MAEFSTVRTFLEERGYLYTRFRKDPGDHRRLFVVFTRPGYTAIGFPVKDKQVADEDFDNIKALFDDS